MDEERRATDGAPEAGAEEGGDAAEGAGASDGPTGAPDAAADLDPDLRPGVPMEAPPRALDQAPSLEPPQGPDRLTRAALDRPTPVYGTAQPPRGLSGRMRRWAYGIPEHRARHWMLLMAADRVDVAEDRLGAPLGRPLEALGFDDAARRVRSDPLSALAGLATGILAAGAVFAWLGSRRRSEGPPDLDLL